MSRGSRWDGARRALRVAVVAGLVAIGIGVACSKTDKITGPAGPLQTIVVSPSPDTIPVGGSKTLAATGQDASGRSISGLTFFWSSSGDSIATVTQSGQVTALKTGQIQIAASVEGVSGFATVTVSPTPVGSITVTPASATLRIATTLQLTDTVKDALGHVLTGQTVTWSSDSTPIVSVDGNGLVTARALGVAHITAASGGKSAQATITVSLVPVRSITITPAAPSVFVTQTTQLTAVTKDSAGNVLSGRIVRWSTANPAIATIDSVAGLLTGVGPGSTQVRARSEGITDSVTATVSTAPPSTVVLSPNVSQVDVGQPVTLTATVTNSTGGIVSNPTVTFTSDKPTVASVTSETGATGQILAGPNAGTATITGTSGLATGTATIIVSLVGVDSVHISAAHDTLTTGQAEPLTATAYDSSGNVLGGRAVTWQSSNTAVATVNGSGSVTAVGPGVAVIFATISGVKGSLALVVNSVPVGSVTITPAADTIQVLQQLQLTATVKNINGTVINPPQTWYSTNTGIAVVTSSGLVTGVGAGQTMIIDSTGGKADTNTTLVLAPVASVVVYPTPDTIFATAPKATVQLNDSAKDANGNYLAGRPVTWSASSGNFATVNSSGLVTGNNVDSATVTITAMSSDGPSGNATVAVLGHAGADSINFSDVSHPDTLSATGVGFDVSDNATATVLDTFNNDVSATRLVTWSTSDSTSLVINGHASVANVVASTPVTLSAVNNVGLPTTVTVTVTTTDGGTVNVKRTLQINIQP